MNYSIHGTFTSYKISKIRWKPSQLSESEHFVTGTLHEPANFLTLWYYPLKESDSENYPVKQSELSLAGDVTEMRYLMQNHLVVSSSFGSVNLFQNNDTNLKTVVSWEKLHYFKTNEPSPCNGLTSFEEDIATIGEDGRIALLTINQTKPIRIIENMGCSLQCISFLKHNEILTGDLRGQMKIWDLRLDDFPTSVFMLSGDQIAAMCTTVHPSQNYLLLVGGEDGSIYIWDLRKSKHALNILNAHKGSVSEMAFHPIQPDHLFTCSAGGEVWHWSTTKNFKEFTKEENAWLSTDSSKQKIDIFSLLPTISKPINSLDINRSRLICGCDNAAVYIIKDLLL